MSSLNIPVRVLGIAAFLLLGGCAGEDGLGVESETASSSGGQGTETTLGESESEGRGQRDRQTSVEADIYGLLVASPGREVVERDDTDAEGRFFELRYQVPIDHDDPGAGTFGIMMTLIHRSTDAPMVLFTTGYHNYFYDSEVELSRLVGGNQLSLEKRFTGASVPDAAWTKLNAAQVAADGHAVTQALRSVYEAPWLRTGGSLGGEDAVYHHYFYPEDFAGVVSYVAPFVLGLADTRFVDHFATAVDQACQGRMEQLQVRMLSKEREGLVAALGEQLYPEEITRVGSHDRALQTLVLELPWNVWQSYGASACAALPEADDPEVGTAELLSILDTYVGIYAVTDLRFETFDAYAYQAFTQLGRPAVPLAHLEGYVDPDYIDLETGAPPPGVPLPFDAEFLPAIHSWVATEATDIIFIYGDLDPWSAGKIDAADNPGVVSYHNPNGLHATRMTQLSGDERAAIEAEIGEWLGDDLGRLGPQDGPAAPSLRVPR